MRRRTRRRSRVFAARSSDRLDRESAHARLLARAARLRNADALPPAARAAAAGCHDAHDAGGLLVIGRLRVAGLVQQGGVDLAFAVSNASAIHEREDPALIGEDRDE